jgi:hypothetical protein
MTGNEKRFSYQQTKEETFKEKLKITIESI